MVTCVMVIEENSDNGNIKIGVNFTSKEPTEAEKYFAADVNAIIEAYSKEAGKLADGGEVVQEKTIVAESPITTAQKVIKHMSTSGKNWEQLEPYLIAQIEKCSFRALSEKEWKSYDKVLDPKIIKQLTGEE